MKRALPLLLVLAQPAAAAAQEAGWHYSPYAGEGDRAAMGCASGSTPEQHSCLVVRCEDDFSIALHIETSREGGDAGSWLLSIDDASMQVSAESVDGSPYGARVRGAEPRALDLVEMLKHGSVAYLEPAAGPPVVSAAIPLNGSLYTINQALYFCAPRVSPDPEAETPAG